MSAKSQLDLKTQMLLEAIEALETVHEFQQVLVTPPFEGSLDIRFSGTKPIWNEYIGANVLISLKYSPINRLWKVTEFNTGLVYVEGRKEEKDLGWSVVRESIKILPGERFLAYKNKTLADAIPKNTDWTIECGADFTAFCEQYDKAARTLGYVPIFLG